MDPHSCWQHEARLTALDHLLARHNTTNLRCSSPSCLFAEGTEKRPNCASHETKRAKPNVINGPRFREYGGVPQRTPELSEGRTSGGCDARLTFDNPELSEERPFADLRA